MNMQLTTDTVHIYDHNDSKLFLDTGRVIKLRNNPFESAESALEPLTRWAKQLQLIGEKDVIATFH
jgi:hypothetical protein